MGVYNKFMADYDKLFDKFTPSEHANIINYFSRVNINREDVVSAAAKAININALPENEKLTLFKSITKLGFYRPEKKLDLIENLLTKIDHTHVLRKQPTIAKLTLLFNAWKLDTYSYDVKSYVRFHLFLNENLFLKNYFYLFFKFFRLMLYLKILQKQMLIESKLEKDTNSIMLIINY